MNLQKILIEIEEVLIPHYGFDIYQRGMYFYLLNQTRVRGLVSSTIPLASISKALNCSEWQARKTIRQLADLKCIELEQSRNGHSVKVLLPEELGISAPQAPSLVLNIEEIDFYGGRKYLQHLMKREGNKCFYCLSAITPAVAEAECNTVTGLKQVHHAATPLPLS